MKKRHGDPSTMSFQEFKESVKKKPTPPGKTRVNVAIDLEWIPKYQSNVFTLRLTRIPASCVMKMVDELTMLMYYTRKLEQEKKGDPCLCNTLNAQQWEMEPISMSKDTGTDYYTMEIPNINDAIIPWLEPKIEEVIKNTITAYVKDLMPGMEILYSGVVPSGDAGKVPGFPTPEELVAAEKEKKK